MRHRLKTVTGMFDLDRAKNKAVVRQKQAPVWNCLFILYSRIEHATAALLPGCFFQWKTLQK